MSESKSDLGRSTKNSRKAAAVEEQNKLLQEVLQASKDAYKDTKSGDSAQENSPLDRSNNGDTSASPRELVELNKKRVLRAMELWLRNQGIRIKGGNNRPPTRMIFIMRMI